MSRIPLKSLTFPGIDDIYVIPLITSLAPAYSTSATYTVGQLVSRDNKIYKCTTAINVGETWNGSHWTEIPISNAIEALNSLTTRLGNRLEVAEDEIEALETIDKIFAFEVDENGHLIETVERYNSSQIEFQLVEGRLKVTYV